jgi:hypothetical protein
MSTASKSQGPFSVKYRYRYYSSETIPNNEEYSIIFKKGVFPGIYQEFPVQVRPQQNKKDFPSRGS